MARQLGKNKIWLRQLISIASCASWGSILTLIIPTAWEDEVYSYLLATGHSQQPLPSVAVIALDDQTFSNIAFYRDDPQAPAWVQNLSQFPWPRQVYATVIERSLAAGAQRVGIDLLFDAPSQFGTSDDQQFRAALTTYRSQTVIGAQYLEPQQFGQGLMLLEPAAALQIPQTAIAYVNAQPAANGQILDLPATYGQTVIQPSGLPRLPSLSSAIAQGITPSPLPQTGRIPFRTTASVLTIPIWDLLDPERYTALQASGVLQNRLVLVGPTATSFQDLHPTPVDAQMPGVVIHAQAVAALVNGTVIQAWPRDWRTRLLLTGLIAAIIGGILIRLPQRRPLYPISWTLAGATLWLSLCWTALHFGQLWLPTLPPLLALISLGSGNSLLSLYQLQRERARLRRSFDRYVSPSIVQQILAQPEEYETQLQGTTCQAAILFADIRDFTQQTRTATQAGKSREFVQKLNQFLTSMVEAIQSEQGTIDKFIGDAVMAEFGVPVSQGAAQDCKAAVRAALAMRQALMRLNQQWQANGETPLKIGIGIAWGEVLVGNLGSPKRLDYTVIGDAVNVASRVEGMTKILNCDILMTAELQQHLSSEFKSLSMGVHALRGYDSQELFTIY